MQTKNQTTPLHAWHLEAGATMGDFSGWSMPLWYPSGAVAEHRAVITHAGMFDTSDMDVLLTGGADSLELLQLCFTRDLGFWKDNPRNPAAPGRMLYGAFLDENGELIDDAILGQFGQDSYILAVNAGMGEIIADHLRNHAEESNCRIHVCRGEVGKIDLQGPMSAKILCKVLQEPERALSDMKYYSFKGHFDEKSCLADIRLLDSTALLLARTGYTGEFGFEIIVDSSRLPAIWETILAAGKKFGLIPCGLAARDSLRAGAVLPLSHQDIGHWPFINNPWSFALPFNEDQSDFTKHFIGDRVLTLRDRAAHTYPFVGYDPRKVMLDDHPVVLDVQGQEIGVVLTCVADMAIDRQLDRIFSINSPNKPPNFKPRGLSCGFVRVKMKLDAGEIVQLRDSRRTIKVMIVDDIRPDRTARRPMREMM